MNSHSKTGGRSIAVLGDSVAKGVVFAPDKNRYVFMQKGFIKELTSKLAAKVFDFSKFGTTSSYGSKLLNTKVSDIDPDIVLIEYGGNDCDYKWDEVADAPDCPHFPNLPLEAFIQNIKAMVSKLKTRQKIPVLMNLPPLVAPRYFDWFSKGDPVRQKSILKWLKRIENIYWWQESYSYAIDQVAHITGTRLIDVRSSFFQKADYTNYICEDGIHPNEAGQRLIEDSFLSYIKKNASHILAY